jgi:putative ABC transport system permease protein
MLGVIIGVLAVILLVAVGEAAQAYVAHEFDDLGSNLLRITPGKQETTGMGPLLAGSFKKLSYENAKRIQHLGRGISGVAPIVVGSGMTRYEGISRNTLVYGVTEEWEQVRGLKTALGRFITNQDVEKNIPVCVLGKKVKEELFGTRNAIEERVSINRRKFLVVGVFEEVGVTLGINLDDIVFIPLTAAQVMFHSGNDQVYQIMVAARTPEDVPAAAQSVHEILFAAHDYTEDFTITDQTSFLAGFERILLVLRIMLGGLASVSLLVGGIGIMNIMLVSVRERIREVGVRMAVGARRRDIGLQFLAESIMLSAMGGMIGIAIGYTLTFAVRTAYPRFPVYCSTWSVALAFFFSLAVGGFFGVYPALKAAKVDPVEALRFE